MNFDSYAFSKQPGFVETEMRKAFKQAVPLRTVVVYCYDPRAVNIPHAVAKAMPGEVYPGEVVQDEHGKKIVSTTTIFPIVVAGGRAVDALRSITVTQHLFGIKNISCRIERSPELVRLARSQSALARSNKDVRIGLGSECEFLLWQAHAAEQVREAGVGAQRIESWRTKR
jgi:hypothetical protein